MNRDDLIGVWQLARCQGRGARGGSCEPYGPAPIGKLIYTPDGHLSVVLMDSRRGSFASEDISQATAGEIGAAFHSFDAYCGRWSFDETCSTVSHQIEAGRIPNWIARNHLRSCSLQEGRLTLATEEFEMGGEIWRMYVEWVRA